MPLRIRTPAFKQVFTVPTGILTIDYGNPLTSGLVGVYVPGGDNGGTNLVDPGNGNVSLYGTATVGVTGTEGLGMQAAGGAMAGTASAAQTTNLTAASLYWRGQNIADEGQFANLVGPDAKADYDAPDRDGFNIRTNTYTSEGFQVVWNDGHSSIATLNNGVGLAVGDTGSVAATMLSSGDVNTYQNGDFVASLDFSGSFSDPPAFDPTARFQVGGTDHFGRYSGALTYVAYMWNRVLDATEMATLNNDPYAFLIAESEATTSFAAFSIPQDAGRRVTKIIGY